MAFFRQYVAPFLVILVFLIALAAVSARIFLPSDMAAPAPIEEANPTSNKAQIQSATPPAFTYSWAGGNVPLIHGQ